MSCGYCNWTSLDIGWQFDSLQDIRRDMAKLKIGGQFKDASTKSPESDSPSEVILDDEPDSVFTTLRSFYNTQLSTSSNTDPLLTPSGGFNYSSPSSLARIMSLYTGRGAFSKKEQAKTTPMRESADPSEGLRVMDPASDMAAIEKLRSQGWTSTASTAQQASQHRAQRFASDLRPTQSLLRSKRSKRCRICRHILVKPEAKVTNTRFRIRLVALNYIPTISLKRLQPAPSTDLPLLDLAALPALRASQFLVTLKNPLFDPVRITLATSAHTPGRYRHKVTILCPQFDIGPNVDQWDEALGGDSNDRGSSKMLNLSKVEYAGIEGGKVAEAGKVWERGRNWTTVVVEAVCQDVRKVDGGLEAVGDDEDVLEIPVFVRMEWEEESEKEEAVADRSRKESVGEKKEKKELAFWVVIGVGRVARLEKPVVE